MKTDQKALEAVTIRRSYPEDEVSIWRLAALDSAAVPDGPFLLGEVDGELRAALSLSDGRVIADPFERTTQLVVTLRAYASSATALALLSPSRGYRPGRLALEY